MYHPCQCGGSCICGGTCGGPRRNPDESLRSLWRRYQQSQLMTDYNVALRAAERAGQVSACRICKVPLVSGQEGAHFRQWLFCNDCYHNTVGSDEVPCEGYEGECNVDGWVYHNKSYIDNRHYASYRDPTIFNVDVLWCDDCMRRAISDADHEISVNDYYAGLEDY